MRKCTKGKYLGDQRASYNQDLKFKLRIDQDGNAKIKMF